MMTDLYVHSFFFFLESVLLLGTIVVYSSFINRHKISFDDSLLRTIKQKWIRGLAVLLSFLDFQKARPS